MCMKDTVGKFMWIGAKLGSNHHVFFFSGVLCEMHSYPHAPFVLDDKVNVLVLMSITVLY